jgi:hypothetical protein
MCFDGGWNRTGLGLGPTVHVVYLCVGDYLGQSLRGFRQ